MVKPSQVIAVDFTTRNPSTGAAKNAKTTPTGVLVVDGVDNAATVTVGAIATGIYSANVTIPVLTAGQVVQIRIAATVTNDDAVDIADSAIIWQDIVDTKRVADLNDVAPGAQMDLVNAPNSTAIGAFKTALEVDGGKLDHLWEMTEDDSGVRRLTTNALEQAPAAPTAAAIADAVHDEAIGTHSGYLTKVNALPASPASTGDIPTMISAQQVRDAMKLAPSAGTPSDGSVDKHLDDAALETTLTAIKGVGWTTQTLKSIGDLLGTLTLATIAQAVWTYTSRSLSQTLASITAALTGSTITIHRGDTFSQTFTLGHDISMRSKFWFTALDDQDDEDSNAIVQVEETAGLLYAEKAAAVSAAYGSLVVTNEASGIVTLTIAYQATALLRARTRRWYDFQMLTESGTIETISEGRITVERDVTKSIA